MPERGSEILHRSDVSSFIYTPVFYTEKTQGEQIPLEGLRKVFPPLYITVWLFMNQNSDAGDVC